MTSRRTRHARFRWRSLAVGFGLGVGVTLALQSLIPEASILLSAIGVESGRPTRDTDSLEWEPPEFRFFTFLPDFELEVDTSHLADRTSKPTEELVYLLQIASYQTEDLANAHRARLVLQGLDAYVVTLHADADDPWYQIRMGPFATREEAGVMSSKVSALADGERVRPLVLVQR